MTRKQYIKRYYNHKRRERLRKQRKAQALDMLRAVLFGLMIGGVLFLAR